MRAHCSFHTVQSLSMKNEFVNLNMAGSSPPVTHSTRAQVPSRSAIVSTITSVNLFQVFFDVPLFSKYFQSLYHGFMTFPKSRVCLTPFFDTTLFDMMSNL